MTGAILMASGRVPTMTRTVRICSTRYQLITNGTPVKPRCLSVDQQERSLNSRMQYKPSASTSVRRWSLYFLRYRAAPDISDDPAAKIRNGFISSIMLKNWSARVESNRRRNQPYPSAITRLVVINRGGIENNC